MDVTNQLELCLHEQIQIIANAAFRVVAVKQSRVSLAGPKSFKEDQDTLIEQSNILLKQSVDQVVSCKLIESGYTTCGWPST